MLDARLRKNLDRIMLALVGIVVALGLATLYSATRDNPQHFYQKQATWAMLGAVALVATASIDYSRLASMAKPLYAINLGLLLTVWKLAPHVKGAARWIPIFGFQLQPSELAKLIMIVCLAAYLSRRLERLHELSTLAGSFAYVALPTVLIFKQPDLGTSLVLIAIWFGMTWVAGARLAHLGLFLLAGAVLFAAAWKLNVLQDYQKNRIVAFINPEVDPQDAGYHVIQARIAIGSGQVLGKGFRHGTQVQGKFIPENQTDFIFTVVGEEGGFVLSVALVVLYGAILLRGVSLIAQVEEALGQLMAAGVVSMLAFHVILNLGMNIGIMPVAGVPLPFLSYGGSSMILNLASVGLLLGIGMRKHRLSF